MKKRIFNITVIFSVITLISKFLGLIRDSMLANNYGASFLTDAYNVAITIPTFFYQLVGLSLMTVFIPFYKEKLINEGEQEANEFANKILTIITLIMILVVTLIFVKPNLIVSIMAPKFSREAHLMTVQLIRISIFNVLFMVLSSVSCGILQSNKEFISTSLMGILLNLPVIVYLIVFNGKNIYVLTLVTGIGFSLQVLIQLPFLKRIGHRLRFNFKLRDEYINKMLISIVPIIIGMGVQQFSVIIDKAMGSSLNQGSITILDFATKINGVIYSIFATSILTVTYPQLSNYLIKKDFNDLVIKIEDTIIKLMFILIPIGMIIILFRIDIISIMYKRGKFSNQDTLKTSLVLGCFIIGMPFTAIRDLFGNVFYSMKNTKAPAINGCIAVILNVILNLILTPIIGISGIALSTSISLIVSSLLLERALKKKIPSMDFKNTFIDIVKIFIASSISVVLVYIIRYIFTLNYISNIKLLIIDTILAGIVCSAYVIILYLLKMNYVRVLVSSGKNDIRKIMSKVIKV